MIGKTCLAFFGLYILFAFLRQWGVISGPTVDTALLALLAAAALSYLPLWIQSVRTGEISLPPRMIGRFKQPVLFWLVATIHLVMALVIAGAMLLQLFGAH